MQKNYQELNSMEITPSFRYTGSPHRERESYPNENVKMASQQYRAWSDCADLQAGIQVQVLSV
jgi:hypothetical protein